MKTKRKTTKSTREPKLSRTHVPADVSPVDWQRALRRQFGREHALDDFCKITNYEKLKSDLDLIAAWAPELVIVDEAQRVKNWNTIAAKALKRIDILDGGTGEISLGGSRLNRFMKACLSG